MYTLAASLLSTGLHERRGKSFPAYTSATSPNRMSRLNSRIVFITVDLMVATDDVLFKPGVCDK